MATLYQYCETLLCIIISQLPEYNNGIFPKCHTFVRFPFVLKKNLYFTYTTLPTFLFQICTQKYTQYALCVVFGFVFLCFSVYKLQYSVFYISWSGSVLFRLFVSICLLYTTTISLQQSPYHITQSFKQQAKQAGRQASH